MAQNRRHCVHDHVGDHMAKTTKPGKQRKRVHQSHQHEREKLMSAHMSTKFLEDTKVAYPRSLPVREGDTVLIMRGDDRGHEGKVTGVDRRALRIFVDGATVTKADGTEVGRPIHPSNVTITKLDMSDPWRRKLIERARGGR